MYGTVCGMTSYLSIHPSIRLCVPVLCQYG